MTFNDGSEAIGKPLSGENFSIRVGISGTLASRESAAYRVSETLGFDRVPPTVVRNTPQGRGSVQRWITAAKSLDHDQYPRVQQEEMAVLDYVIGNTDRHKGNYLTDVNGSIIAIDHGYSFPEFPDRRFGIRSDFAERNVRVPLSPEIMNKVRAVDVRHFRIMLEDVGLSDIAIDGAIARLEEIRRRGMITGEAWPGLITGAYAYPPTQPMTSFGTIH
ncbi:hypothetical protein ACQPXH_15720 [Nocardia sp. CA-135953]|uniref:hypothetical protein n=1 Tax=Nocardia sp. CA-135953 TaxID=3239978 RepID=UPI003D9741F7